MRKNEIKKEVKKRYGQLAKESSSCCPDYSCCDIGYSVEEIKDLPVDITEFSLGCGNPGALADIRKGETILDIGSGGGLDVFLASRKVGPEGKVIGLDMTEQMVEKARQNAKKGNYNNVEFKLGEVEDIPVKDNSIDLVMSNCVINLVPDKEKAYREIYRILKPSGRFVISDVVTEKELDEVIRNNPEKLVACVGGALTEKEYIGAIKKSGFKNVKILKKSSMIISGVKVLSETVRGEKR
ncbi:arsenite methyltransferase [bacterium]|nr:arsenite methyltransferase [bacterium]